MGDTFIAAQGLFLARLEGDVEGDGLHVHIEDILPPILIVLGRLVMDVQHFFKMHKTLLYVPRRVTRGSKGLSTPSAAPTTNQQQIEKLRK